MTERKPPGVSWRTWIDRQIEAGVEDGAFDELPGAGKPLAGIDRPHDDLWWVKDKLRREGVEDLPESLAVNRDAGQALQQAMHARTDDEARRIIEAINERIRYVNSHTVQGPPTSMMPFDVDEVLAARTRRDAGDHGAT